MFVLARDRRAAGGAVAGTPTLMAAPAAPAAPVRAPAPGAPHPAPPFPRAPHGRAPPGPPLTPP